MQRLVDGYPELPYVSIQKRVPKGWWDQQERKNFNETVSSFSDSGKSAQADSSVSYSCMSRKMHCPCGRPMFTLHRQAGLSPRYVQSTIRVVQRNADALGR